MKKCFLYLFMIAELYLALGGLVANEYNDFIFQGIFSVILSVITIFLLYQFVPKKIPTIFILMTVVFYMLTIINILTDESAFISNFWPIELFYQDRPTIIVILTVILFLQLVKLAILYRCRIFKNKLSQ